jgi:hypothetical protein
MPGKIPGIFNKQIHENMARKFIITATDFRMADVELHSDLCKNLKNVLGGGLWFIDRETNILYLWGASMDFGYAYPAAIKEALPNALISPSLDGFKVMHSPIVTKQFPELSTFTEIYTLSQ